DSAGGSDTATPTDTRMTADGETDTEGPDGVVLNTPEEAFAAVDPLIGTGGEGYSYAAMTPAAQVPLGMVRVGPDSTNAGSHWAGLHHASGYWYNDPDVRGFSHTHFVGTGVADYGHHRVMALREEDLERFEPGTAWASKDTAWERGEPGYYTTRLVEPEVEVELAATLRTGVHRYTPRGEPERPMMVLFDAGSTVRDDGVEEASIRVEGGRIEGEVLYTRGYSTRSRPYRVYMAAVIEPEPLEVWSWDETGYRPGETEVSGSEKAGLVMRFAGDGPVVVKVGLSFIDRAGAWANLEAEAMPYTFDEVRAQAAADWMEVLGQVEVAGGEPKDHRVLFTALYNAYRMPTRLDEVDGRYRGLDGDVHTVEEGSAYYTDLSLWDTFRTVHPWYTLVSPDVQRDCLRSLLRMAQQGDRGMPRWPAALSYTQGMIGRSADVLFGESALKGIEGVDYAAAADILLGEAFPGPNSDPQAIDRELLESYDTFGYVPQDRHDQSVSETLEHSYHDWALAHLAASQGLPEAERLAERSKSYTALFDAEAGFFRPRLSDGRFEENARFDPTNHYERSGPYTEGSAWHWLFYVPHDPEGLMALMGGRETMLERLETFMTASKFRSREALDRILPDSYYWHANQPSLHVVYLFAQLGAMERFSSSV
ncbi:MAG: GH92 family glycosyl hydrolase, partial [Myxococcota bacterium]